jgi:hypothetical protein
MGIPVFPLQPNEKVPAKGFMAWQIEATTDLAKINEWNDQNSECNCGLVAKKDGVCFLEFDMQGGMKAAAEEMGQPIPVTRVHRSGKGFAHYIFRHTEKSNALGNRQANLPNGHEWFSLRSLNRYVVGAGSVHPNGNMYTVLRDIEPTPIPDWVLEWVAKNSKAEVSQSKKDGSPVVDEFDFEDFIDHYGEATALAYTKDNNFHVTEVCPATWTGPGTGRRHEGSTETGFFYDGSHLGFKCFAQGCPGSEMSIGQLLKHLNQYCEPYPENIWPERDISSFLDDVEWADDVDADEVINGVPEPAVEPVVVATIPAAPVANPPVAEVVKQVVAEVTVDLSEGYKYPELRFPYEALPEGRLKTLTDEACAGELDPGLVVPALMGLASAVPAKNVHDGDLRINLYVCLLALVGGGKDVAVGRAIQALGLANHEGQLYTEHNPSGERAVAMLLCDKKDKPGPKHHCIVSYELEETLKKAKADTSGVLQAMQHFYDHDTKTLMMDSKKGTTQKIDCRLSWLSGFPVGDKEIEPTKFKSAFGENSSHGLSSRLLFGFSERRFDNRKARMARRSVPMQEVVAHESCDYAPEPQDMSDWDTNSITAMLRGQVVEGFEPDAEQQFINWNPEEDYSGRDTFHVRKVAVIVALLNGHRLVDMGDWLFAKAFMEWQGQLRRTFQSSKSQRVTQGAFNEIVLDETSKRTDRLKKGTLPTKQGRITEVADGEKVKRFHWINWGQMSNSMRWAKYGMDVERTIDQLVRSNALQYLTEREENKDGKEIWVENKKYVRIFGTW